MTAVGPSRRCACVAAFLAITAAGNAGAYLRTGTLLTNSASITYSVGSQGASVTYSATARVLVANPGIDLWKRNNPTFVSASAGGVLTFTICFSNWGDSTAFNVSITDRLPLNAYWSTPPASCGAGPGYFNGTTYAKMGTVPTAFITFAWATALAGPWTAGCPSSQPMGGSSQYFLRWTIARLDVGRSACLSFTVSLW